MPGFNRTGPQDQGAQTGMGSGKCNPITKRIDDSVEADELSKGLGMRKGSGRGKGRGTGRGQGRGLGRNNAQLQCYAWKTL